MEKIELDFAKPIQTVQDSLDALARAAADLQEAQDAYTSYASFLAAHEANIAINVAALYAGGIEGKSEDVRKQNARNTFRGEYERQKEYEELKTFAAGRLENAKTAYSYARAQHETVLTVFRVLVGTPNA